MASGDTIFKFSALHNEPPSASAATIDLRNQHPVLDHAADSDESSIFSDVLSRNYAAGGLTVFSHWAMSSAESACIDVDMSFERIGFEKQDLDSDGFAAANSKADVAVSASSGFVFSASIAFTDGSDMDSIAVGEPFRLKVTRKSSTDGAAGDAELTKIEGKET